MKIILSALLACTIFSAATATIISYELSDLSNGRFQYSYTIENDSPLTLDNFSIFFDLGSTTNIFIESNPLDWTATAYQPSPAIPDDGFVDVYTFSEPLNLGEILTNLVVSFDWTSNGHPSSQEFAIYSADWEVIETGLTRMVATVSEPATFPLLALGVMGIIVACRKARLAKGESQ